MSLDKKCKDDIVYLEYGNVDKIAIYASVRHYLSYLNYISWSIVFS